MVLDQPDSPLPDRASELRMSFGEHLEELRTRLIRVLVGICVCAAITFTFGFHLIAFLARPLLQTQHALNHPPQTIETDPTFGFTSVYLPVSLISATILCSPWVIYQLWTFVVSGLYAHEKKMVYLLTPFSMAMTAMGVAFTYWILLPVSLLFFLNFASLYPEIEAQETGPVMRQLLRAYGKTPSPIMQPAPSSNQEMVANRFPSLNADPTKLIDGMSWINRPQRSLKTVIDGQIRILATGSNRLITPLPRLGQYVRFAAMMILGVVLAFQVPVVMLVMGWTGLFDPNQIVKLRRYAIFACAALGAVITPTDLFSMFVLAVPLYALFEFGLLLMRWVDRGSRPD